MKQKFSAKSAAIEYGIIAASIIWTAACGSQPVVVGGPKREAVKMGDVTLQNMLHMPDGQDYLEAPGRGVPPDSEKDRDVRQRIARDSAVIDAEKQLITKLGGIGVKRSQIQDLLRKSTPGPIQYGYDDTCTLTLRVPLDSIREAIEGKQPLTP